MEKMKWLLSTLLGLIATFAEQYGVLIAMVCVSICFDVVTGLLKAKLNEGINSQTGTRGFFKKIALLVCMFFGFFLDYCIPFMFGKMGITLPTTMPFGMIVCFYIVLNELISICENLYACDSSIMPKWIVKLLTNTREKIDDEIIKEE